MMNYRPGDNGRLLVQNIIKNKSKNKNKRTKEQKERRRQERRGGSRKYRRGSFFDASYLGRGYVLRAENMRPRLPFYREHSLISLALGRVRSEDPELPISHSAPSPQRFSPGASPLRKKRGRLSGARVNS
jgi:hypothetical protein